MAATRREEQVGGEQSTLPSTSPSRRKAPAKRATQASAHRRTGVDLGADHSAFESKSDLLLHAVMRRFRRGTQEWIEVVARGGTLQATIDELGRMFVAGAIESDWAILLAELDRHAAQDASFANRYRKALREHHVVAGRIITDLYALGGRLPPERPALLSSTLQTVALALQQQAAAGVHGADASHARDMFVLYLRALVASGVPRRRRVAAPG